MYEELLGPYPWSRFSVVENFWETGYGMPSFTLLGPKVIRFPFLLHSSFPHELLHNWWGNGVYLADDDGNSDSDKDDESVTVTNVTELRN